MYMQKKVYVTPNFEVYNMEPESMLAYSTKLEGDDYFGDDRGTNDANDSATRKKQYGFNSAPWE